jgi:Ca2+-binding EF-hand superfamily protein
LKKKILYRMNENGCGYLNFLEFRACLVEFGMAHLTNLMVKQILDNVNGNGTKMVDFGEFLNMWERAAEKDQTLPFSDDLYHALKRMDMLPTKPAPVPFERAKNFFETKVFGSGFLSEA